MVQSRDRHPALTHEYELALGAAVWSRRPQQALRGVTARLPLPLPAPRSSTLARYARCARNCYIAQTGGVVGG